MSVPIPQSPPDRSGIHPEKLQSVSKTQPSCEPLEQVVDVEFRKQLVLSVPQYEPGEWKYEFKMSSFTTTILNLLFAEAEQQKLSLDFKFDPWDTGITFRPEWRSMSTAVFKQYDPSESWYTEQSDVWLDNVKTFYHRPVRCVIVVHPYSLAQEDTALLTESAYLSCAKNIDDSRFVQTCTRTSA